MTLVALFALLGVDTATPRRALIVAYNGSDRPGTAPLRFADDDGYRWREALQRLGVDATLLTVPDAETTRLEADRGLLVRPPTWSAVEQAVSAIARENASQKGDVLFIYVGHGQTDTKGRAYLTLADGRMDQRALYERVVDAFGADYVHLIIDACHAGGVVGSRGGSDKPLIEQLKAALLEEQLKARPHVGALFAESEEGETHEWSRIRAGVFSHAARSGLLGGADVNHDGRVGYSELDAFIAAAIRGVKSVRARLSVKTSPPMLDATRALVGPAPAGPVLEVPSEPSFARVSIDDSDGVRIADINRLPGERVAIALPARSDYWLRTSAGDARVPAEQLSRRRFALSTPEIGSRGGVEESYTRGLFAMPFGRAFYDGFQASSELPPVAFAETEEVQTRANLRHDGAWLGWGLSIGLPVTLSPLGASGIATGVALTWRSDGVVYYGARAQYTVTPVAFDGATLHRFAAGPLAGVRGPGAITPFAEVAAHWAPNFAARTGSQQGDWAGFGARLSAGAQGSRDLLRSLRLGISLDVDVVRLDGAMRGVLLPGLELSIAL